MNTRVSKRSSKPESPIDVASLWISQDIDRPGLGRRFVSSEIGEWFYAISMFCILNI